jgi:hypothetical protein
MTRREVFDCDFCAQSFSGRPMLSVVLTEVDAIGNPTTTSMDFESYAHLIAWMQARTEVTAG